MSRTKLHKQKGRWKNGVEETIPTKLNFHFDRRNYEFSYFTEWKLKAKEKDLNKDMQNELNNKNN